MARSPALAAVADTRAREKSFPIVTDHEGVPLVIASLNIAVNISKTTFDVIHCFSRAGLRVILPDTDGSERSWTKSGRSSHTFLSQVMEIRLDTNFVSFVDFEVRTSLFNDIKNPFTKGIEWCILPPEPSTLSDTACQNAKKFPDRHQHPLRVVWV